MQQKTGIAIQEERNPYNGYFQKILTQLVAGTGPDLIEIDANENGNFFTSGTLVPFNDYVKSRSDGDPAKWNADPLKENGYQGKILGLSLFTMQDLIVHINQELADKDGLLKDAPLWGTPGYDAWHLQDKFVEWLKAGTKVK